MKTNEHREGNLIIGALADGVLVRLDPPPDSEKKSGAIIIPEMRTKDELAKGAETGVVLAIGHLIDKEKANYNIGDRVGFKRYIGSYVLDRSNNLRYIQDADVLITIKEVKE